MKKIEVNQILKNFKGEELKGENGESLTIGKALSNVLVLSQDGDKMKTFVLSQRLYTENGVVDLDESDFQLVKKAVETDKAYSVMVTGQLLVNLSNIQSTEVNKK